MEYLFVTHIHRSSSIQTINWMGGRQSMNVWTVLVTHHHTKLCHARGSMSRVSVMFSVSFVRKQLKWYPIRLWLKWKCSQSTEVFIFSSCGWGRVAEVSDSWDCLQFSGPRQVLMSRVQDPGSVLGSRHFYLVYWGLTRVPKTDDNFEP